MSKGVSFLLKTILKLLLDNQVYLIKFLIVGGLTAILYIGIFSILWKITNLHYQIAISISYVISVILYFIAHRKFTFKNQHHTISKQLPRYFALLLLNYIITLLVMHFVVETLHLSPPIGNVMAIAITFMFSFMLSRFWIFNPIKP